MKTFWLRHTNGDGVGTNRLSSCQEATPSINVDNQEQAQAFERKPVRTHAFRDRRGRFTMGNPGGPGNPFAKQIAGFRRAICRAVSQRDLEKLARSLLERAGAGDDGAAALLLAYTVGKPSNVVNPDTTELDEWKLIQQLPVRSTEIDRILHCITPELASKVVRALWPVAESQFKDGLGRIARGEPVAAT